MHWGKRTRGIESPQMGSETRFETLAPLQSASKSSKKPRRVRKIHNLLPNNNLRFERCDRQDGYFRGHALHHP